MSTIGSSHENLNMNTGSISTIASTNDLLLPALPNIGIASNVTNNPTQPRTELGIVKNKGGSLDNLENPKPRPDTNSLVGSQKGKSKAGPFPHSELSNTSSIASFSSKSKRLTSELANIDSVSPVSSVSSQKLRQNHIATNMTTNTIAIYQTEFPRLEASYSGRNLQKRVISSVLPANDVVNDEFPSVESIFEGVAKNLASDEKLWELINKLCTP